MSSLLERLREALAPHYDIQRELASGGMSTVFLARDTVLDRRVAVKVVRPEGEGPIATRRLLNEARVLARLSHPNVIPVFDAAEIGGSFCYVMDYVDGDTLADRLEDGPMTPEEAVRLGSDLLSALQAAHELGIVHRDVKPGNVFLVGDRALLGDFGIAKEIRRDATTLTEPGQRVGTPGYMAPEQLAGEASPRTDLYAVGMILYEVLTGRRWSVAIRPDEADWSGVPDELVPVIRRAVRWSPEDRWPEAGSFRRALIEAAPEGRVDSSAGERAPPARGSTTWRRALIGGAIALVFVGIASGVWFLRPAGPGGNAGPTSVSTVAVLPFSVRGSDEYAYLGEGMVDLLSTNLDGAGSLRSADARAVLAHVARVGAGAIDPERGQEIAERLAADYYVLGNVVAVGTRLRVDASLYAREPGLEAIAEATAEGEASEIFELVDELTAQLVIGGTGGPGDRMTRIAALTTNSLEALKAYLEGEQAFRAGKFLPAAEAFQRATAADSTFALAWYRLSVTGDWLVRTDLVLEGAEQALRHAGRLSEHDRRLLRAHQAKGRGDAEEAERLYRAIVGTYVEDIEAWVQLGEVLFHFGPVMGRPVAESREAFERALFYEPDDVNSLDHLVRIAALEKDTAAIDSLVDRFLSLGPEADRALEVRAVQAFATGDERDRRQVLSELADAEDGAVMVTAWAVPVFTGTLAGGQAVARVLTDARRSAELRALGHALIAHLELAGGRWAAARAELRASETFDPAAALEYRALLSAAPFLPVSEGELRSIRAELVEFEAEAVRPSANPSTWVSVHEDVHPLLRLYLLGLVSAELGDEPATLRYAAELEELNAGGEPHPLGRALPLSLRAEVAAAEGRVSEALSILERSRVRTWYQRPVASPFYSQAHERYHRAELLASIDRTEEALAWYGSFAELNVFDLVYSAPSHLRRAEIYERMGDVENAIRHYERFLELWSDPDPELREMVELAERRLSRLRDRAQPPEGGSTAPL